MDKTLQWLQMNLIATEQKVIRLEYFINCDRYQLGYQIELKQAHENIKYLKNLIEFINNVDKNEPKQERKELQ